MIPKTTINGKNGIKAIMLSLLSFMFTANVIFADSSAIIRNDIHKFWPPDTVLPVNTFITAIAPTKMNVLYVGIENPLDIAVTGAQEDKISVSISNGTIRKLGHSYLVTPKSAGIAIIKVFVEKRLVASREFRAKLLPDPTPAIRGGLKQGSISTNELIQRGGLEAVLEGFDMNFKVTGFVVSEVVTDGKTKEIEQKDGPLFSKEQIELIRNVKYGKKVYFKNIKAQGPDGITRDLGSFEIKIR